LKWFDVSRQTLLGQGKVFVGKNQKVGDLHGLICEKMGWPASTPLKLYEVCGTCSMAGNTWI
jgi:ubiquitin carboxyl-terminal hydrolase 7